MKQSIAIALANAVQEAKFLMQLCLDMKVGIKEGKSLIMIDNQGAMNLAKNPVQHQRSKHIDIKYHFIRSEIQEGRISLDYIPTEENAAQNIRASGGVKVCSNILLMLL